jgi:UDP-N-acetylmuramate dehydrogenase
MTRRLLFGITGTRVLKNELLKKHTSFHIGGAASYFVYVYSKKALVRVLQTIRKKKMRYFVLGAGTNVLFSDRGFAGVIIKLSGVFKKVRRKDNHFVCGAGITIETFLRTAVRQKCGGAEFLVGIPGTIGGGIKGNAGAFGKSFADITRQIFIVNEKGEEKCLNHSAIGFGYRTSRLRHGVIVLSAVFDMKRRSRSRIMHLMARNHARRMQRMPLGFSAGSFFKNPLPKTAGALIESCGLKGSRVGDAEVSARHANWIINRGEAKASDVVRLMRMIQRTVKREKGIALQTEVQVLK